MTHRTVRSAGAGASGSCRYTGAAERVGGDPELAEAAGRIREEGWRASRAHRRSGEGLGGWPPADAALPIRLGRAEWAIIRQELDR